MSTVSIEHIEVDAQNVARIVGKRTKVIQIVMDKMANGWDAETIHAQYPYLSLAEIHAAFAYYYDHQPELDRHIVEGERLADEAQAAASESPVVARLRKSGQLS